MRQRKKVRRATAAWSTALFAVGLAFGCSDEADSSGGNENQEPTGTGASTSGDGDTPAGDGDSPGDGDGSGGFSPSDPCLGDLVFCSSGCQDLSSDPSNCGACGYLCTSAEMCDAGECVDDPNAGGAGGGGGAESRR